MVASGNKPFIYAPQKYFYGAFVFYNNTILGLAKEISKRKNVIDHILWGQEINNISNLATEIINTEIIYTV